jgi:hypothetical protein
MCHTLVNAQLVDKRATQREINIISVFFDCYNGSKFLNDTGKHLGNLQLDYLQFTILKRKGPPSDVMKTPVLQD